MNEEFDVMTVEEISKQFDAHPNTVRKYIKDGTLKGKKFGKGYKVLKSSVREVFGVTAPAGAQ
jgi:excisionase family DNA binding protein